MMQQRLLLMCEPFGALNAGTKSDMHALRTRLWRARGTTVVMVTHDLTKAFSLATRVVAPDRIRHDRQAWRVFSAIITFDIKDLRTQAAFF